MRAVSSSVGFRARKEAAAMNEGLGAMAVEEGEEAALTASSVHVVVRGGEDATGGEIQTEG